MPPLKRKVESVLHDEEPSPKRRATRHTTSLVATQFEELEPSRGQTGLDGGYWSRTSPSKHSKTLKTNDGDNSSGDEILLSPSKRVTGRTSTTRGTKTTVMNKPLPKRGVHSISTSLNLDDGDDDLGGYAPPDSPTKSSVRKVASSKIQEVRPHTTEDNHERTSPRKRPIGPPWPRKNPPLADTPSKNRNLSANSKGLKSRQGIYDASSEDELDLQSLHITSPAKASTAKSRPFVDIAPLEPLSFAQKLSSGLEENESDALPTLFTTTTSPRKPHPKVVTAPSSPSRLPRVVPVHLHPCFNAQKRAVLCALQISTPVNDTDDDGPSTNALAYQQLSALLQGTTRRGEGNSCMLVGPKGSGKTSIFEKVLADIHRIPGSSQPIVIRLSGHVQTSDRLAMREIARQLVAATGGTGGAFLDEDDDEDENHPDYANSSKLDIDEDENPFLDGSAAQGVSVKLPPTAHLPSLINTLPTLGRPVIVLLDSFDLFALHPRQALLYCLLDTVQHASQTANYGNEDVNLTAVTHNNNGLAVVGLTTRIDTLELLEKRVKSRFSGRMIRTAGPGSWESWEGLVRDVLQSPISTQGQERVEWEGMWNEAVERLLADRKTQDALRESVALVKDVRMIYRSLTGLVLHLRHDNPWPTSTTFTRTLQEQRVSVPFAQVHALDYPSTCLLVAATHASTAGLTSVTFEQLHDAFVHQVRRSTAAPVQLGGALGAGAGGIGMVKCARGVMQRAFETLVRTKVFVLAEGKKAEESTGREFVKYRCVMGREEVKRLVERLGQTNIRKWFTKAQ